MEIYGVIVIVLWTVISFFGGIATANWFNEKAKRDERYALERQYLRLRAGSDWNDPAGPYLYKGNGRAGGPPSVRNMKVEPSVSGSSFSQMQDAFEEKLNNTGSATVLLKNNPTNKRKGD